jgi:hypothetical protein
MAEFTEPKLLSASPSKPRKSKFLRPRVTIPSVEKITSSQTSGITYQGIVKTTYASLVKIFGEPTKSPGLESKVQWYLKIGDTVVKIFDYKSRRLPERNHQWYISGYTPDALLRVAMWFPNDVVSIYQAEESQMTET